MGAGRQAERMRSLDGMRAVAIVLVCIGHWSQLVTGGRLWGVFRYTDIADLGVRIFFVLSGFLITTLLLKERQSRGSISLRRFYFRRTLRIFPAAYVFVLLVVLVNAVGIAHLRYGNPLLALVYVSDYVRPNGWALLHTWSLSIEEQFYVLWPLALVLFGRRGGVRVALAALALCPVIRLAMLLVLRHQGNALIYQFEFQADALATGCLLACCREVLWDSALYRRILTSRWFVLVPVMVFLIAEDLTKGSRPLYALYFFAGYTVMNVGVMLSLDWCMRFSTGRIGSLLNARIVVWVGVVSYSIYLWQELFLTASSPVVLGVPALNIVVVPALAAASYYVVERPGLRLRSRIEPHVFPRSQSHDAPSNHPAAEGVAQRRQRV